MRNNSCSCNEVDCPHCNPCEPFGPINPNVPCTCSASFKIKTKTQVSIFPVGNKSGILTVIGSICPNCNNDTSNFFISFTDLDLSEGDQSFRVSPVSIEPSGCSQSDNRITLGINFAGIYKPTVGNPQLVIGQMNLSHSLTGGQVSVDIALWDYSFNLFLGAAANVPPTSVTITQCS
ncbi:MULTISPECIES: hypothetical protein [Bacillaceae]|uniref:Uncharacterized protein n=1 Tax=Cytobacillus firmus TaxID=1399 RepID=A0AA46PTH0_CYTFI|nr:MULTISPECIES: hypothetical protein [Bacillaceae]MCC3649052.1 hypothetical protein [Cytobacillus oceanisediminis]UYG97440.1 hypothetical protein OD459_10655 [Cytobacillus firmus]WHY34863.1 hypothetical protein QNH44_03635 [Cytobacillus firmus]